MLTLSPALKLQMSQEESLLLEGGELRDLYCLIHDLDDKAQELHVKLKELMETQKTARYCIICGALLPMGSECSH